MDFRKVFIEISNKEFKSVGERMKAYENEGKSRLTPNTPVIINVDGQNFKKYASSFSAPFDESISAAMKHATKKVCSAVQNAKVGYSYSDKATIVVVDPNEQMWFDGNVQDIVSTVSGLFTFHFNDHIKKVTANPAIFRCGVFQVPHHEINNVLVWRQRCSIRSALSSVADERIPGLKSKSPSAKLQALIESGFDISSVDKVRQRGFCIVKELAVEDSRAIGRRESAWGVDDDIPVFSEDRGFVDCILKVGDFK
jgi:tRNA(His) 5'-end guanylyltransferase